MEIIEEISRNFSPENLKKFLQKNIDKFEFEKEDFSFYLKENEQEKYQIIEKIGESKLENDKIIFILCKTTAV